jgi:hypothetical protein
MPKELKVTDEKVKEAAASCPDARRVLQKLFPEVFVEPVKSCPLIGGSTTYLFPDISHPLHYVVQIMHGSAKMSADAQNGLLLTTTAHTFNLEDYGSGQKFLRITKLEPLK